MGKIKQHNMIKMKRGECHPIFDLAYLPENIASLIETTVLLFEGILVGLFLMDLLIMLSLRTATDSNLTFLVQMFSTQVLTELSLKHNFITVLVAELAWIAAFIESRVYFEFIKYNLHPRIRNRHTIKLPGISLDNKQITHP